MTSENSYELHFKPSKRRSFLCKDVYTIATSRAVHMPISLGKERKITVKKANDEKMIAVKNFGIHVYRSCDKLKHILPDLFLTIGLFFGGLGSNPKVPVFGSKPTWW